MDSALPPLQPAPPAPRRSKLPLVAGIAILAVAAVALAWWLRRDAGPANRGEQNEQLQREALAAFEQSQQQQRLANLEGIHLLISRYRQEHGSYPATLADLTDIRGYAPAVAKMVAESKLDDGQPAYSYTPAEGSYQLCANQKDAEAKCEGPK